MRALFDALDAMYHTLPSDPARLEPDPLPLASYLGETGVDLGKLGRHPGKVGTHLGNIPAHLWNIPTHFSKVGSHLGDIPAHLFEVTAHFGKVGGYFGGLTSLFLRPAREPQLFHGCLKSVFTHIADKIKKEFDGVKLAFDLGTASLKTDMDLRPHYTLNWLPAPGQSAVIKARTRYLYKGEEFGNWSEWHTWTLTGA